jgi:hypothetical protein
MRHFKLFEEFSGDSDRPYNNDKAQEALSILKKTHSVSDLYRMGLGPESSAGDVKYLYYKECKRDVSNLVKRLAYWVAEECVTRGDIELFNHIASEYSTEVTSMKAILDLLKGIGEQKDTEFAKNLLTVISNLHDGDARIIAIVKKYQPDPGKFDDATCWILQFLFDEGLMCVDYSKSLPYQVDFTRLPTKMIEKLGKDVQVTEESIRAICSDQSNWTDFKERIRKFVSLPPVWEYLKKHPDDVDKKVFKAGIGNGTQGELADFMPPDKLAELNHARRGRLGGKKFGF